MRKKLIALMLGVMIAACGCGAAQTGATGAVGSNSEAAQESAETQDAKPAQESAEVQTIQAAQESTEARTAESAQETAAAEEPAAIHIAHRYASRSEGQELLLGNEDFFSGFSQNELDFKMQKKDASMDEYKAYAAEQVEDFTQEEMDAADAIFADMEKTLDENGYTIPPLDEIVLIKTTMKEEPGASAYTHGTQIYLSGDILGQYMSDPSNEALVKYTGYVFWHEMFHCLTRCNPDFRSELYKLIHFTVVEEDYPIPPCVFEYHISNPDVERHNSYATFRIDGQNIDCFTDFVTTQHFEQDGDSFFVNGTTALIPVDGSDIYYTPEQAENYLEVFGKNTSYVIDPEECMADNFAYTLAYGKDGPGGNGYPNPEIIEGIMTHLSTP